MAIKSSSLSLAAAAVLAAAFGIHSGAAARHDQHSAANRTIRSAPSKPVLHAPGVTRYPKHGPSRTVGVKTGGGKRNCIKRGTVVHDHRGGKDCSYVAGDSHSYSRYLRCEGSTHGGGLTPWC
jgi:hypothetical protein